MPGARAMADDTGPITLGPLATGNVFLIAPYDRTVQGIAGIPSGVVIQSVVLGVQHLIATPGTFVPDMDHFYFEPRRQPCGLALLVRVRNTTAAPIECAL